MNISEQEPIIEKATATSRREELIFKHGLNVSGHRFTIGIKTPPVNSDTVKVSIALCSKKNQFNKKRGRTIVEKRLEKNKKVQSFVMNKELSMKDNINHIYDSIISIGKPEIINNFKLIRSAI